ncbi:hypothetical protein DM01DRAFT_319139 [Hesseltinella vesiculosa]|uniref:TM7S3/TM198-like domain-containing protein n=1 Tax=Hesseltinella vesiculosa TaxID=101127 RepID=A0A1X2GUI9_9FUNG|nr:hypothetical protein DM01DRAFT_319139 [Hesseltinella vesiculosa]
MAVYGFLALGLVTWVGLTNCQPEGGYINDGVTMLAVPAGLGVLGAVICFIVWIVGMYVIGAVAGLAFALFVLCWRQDLVISSMVARICFLTAMPLVFAGATFFLERHIILVSTAFVGAYLFTLAVDLLARTGYAAGVRTLLDRNPAHAVDYNLTKNVYVLLAVTLLLFLISCALQHLLCRGRQFGVRYVTPAKPHSSPSAAHEEHLVDAPTSPDLHPE